MQHCNCVVELSNLDLEREKEGGEARAEQHVTKGLRGQATRGPAQRSADPSPKDTLALLAQPTGLLREARLCLSLPAHGDFVCVKAAQVSSCMSWWKAKAGPQHAVAPCPSQCHCRALRAELQAPSHITAPPHPAQSTRQPCPRELTVAYSTCCNTVTRKPLSLIIQLCYAPEWPFSPSCILLSSPKAEWLLLRKRRVKKLESF